MREAKLINNDEEENSMLTKRTLITLISLFLLFVVLEQPAFGQTKLTKLTSCAEIENSEDFSLLGTTAGELNSEVQQLETDLEKLPSQLLFSIPQQQIDKDKKEIEELKAKPQPTPAEAARLEFLLLQIRTASTESVNEIIEKTRSDLEKKKDLVRCIQHRLSTIFSPEQKFKLTMSITFAALIGFVIIGFFLLSYKDEFMRRAIFAGQTGIQFLTLFSIVIAIILFGITGILEDKELAALLGGISGYILGRSSTASNAPEPSFLERLASISISPASLLLTAAAPSSQLAITPKDKSGNVLKVDPTVFKPVWISSDPAVATVDQSGLVTRVAVGACNISASFNGITSNTCAVTCS